MKIVNILFLCLWMCHSYNTFHTSSRYGRLLPSPLRCEAGGDAADVLMPVRKVRVIDTNPFGTPISVSSPFGNKAISVAEAKKEILDLSKNGVSEPRHAYRIDYLVKYLESMYVPIHTPDFYSMTHRGNWSLVYSNVLSPRADEKL